MDKTRAKRRYDNLIKAKRKQTISRSVYGLDWYRNLHQYSKNKVHCSCGLCRFKSTYEPDNKPIPDKKRVDEMDYEENEYINYST